MLRWTCGKSTVDMIPNGVFRAELEVDSIIDKMREGRLRWFGHLKRRPQTAPVRRVEALLVDGSRRRGRPKLRWEDRLKQDMKELRLSEDMTSDRNAWRDRIRTTLGWYLEEIRVTWTQFGKKWTRFQLYTKIDFKRAYSAWRRRRDSLRRRQKAQSTASKIFETASEVADLKKPIKIRWGDDVAINKRRTMAGVDVNTLTMEQYLALSRENQAPGVVKPKIGGNVNFEINSQFMSELRGNTFSRNKDEDAHNHIDRVLSIIGLFNIPESLKTQSCSDFSLYSYWSRKKMGGQTRPRNYQYLGSPQKSLYPKAWERYNDLLYKCPTHDINSHQKVNIFYKGLSTMNRQLLDSQGPIPGMTPAQALTTIQTMADHSQKWHDGTTSKNIGSSSSNDGLAALVNKLDNLGRDMKKIKENVHAIQVRYGEFGRTTPFNGNNKEKFRVGPPGYYTKTDNRPPYGERRQSLKELLAKHHDSPKKLKNLHGISFLSDSQEENTNDQLPMKESNPGHFTLPCTIDQTPNSTVILERPFLATVHAQISVFEKEISVGIGDEMVKDSVWSESGENNETLSLGRKNGLRFRKMIIEEMEEVLGNDGEDSDDKTYNGHESNLKTRQICDNKCKVTFSEHDSEITKDGKVISRCIRKKGLYVMKLGNKQKDQICLTTIDENSTLQHRRLGHTNMRLVQLLASKELVRNLPKLKFDQHFCDDCKMGKQTHASHKAKNVVSTTRCLELLHMDLFGPFAVQSYGGNRYTLVIVDDYSRYTWTRFLKDKTEAFDQLEIFSRKIQNQFGCSIVSIRTDHGREFDNEVQFGEFCNASGITHNFSAPRTPQSNGVVEKKNRTLEEMSRTMFNEQSLPQKFWCNAVDTSTYILNRILIRAILGKTPYELLRGRKPTLDYFRVFGSKCFILNTKDYLTKFDPKSYEGVFLGYSQNSKAYIILNKHTRKVKESLNVTFDETPPPSKTSPLVDDDLDEEEAIKVTEKKNLENDIVDETLEIDEIVNIKESRNHPLENVIGNFNQRTLRLANPNIDELESDKAEFSNMYDMLLQECVSKDVMCSYLHSLSDLDAHTELQCLYLHKVKECDCLAQKLSKQTEFVKQLTNDKVCKEKASNVFRKEREQYFKIQDLKAQLQDNNIAISELKKLIEKCKGKYVETKFDKPSVVRQPNAQRIPKPSILRKLTPFSDSFERKNFTTEKSVSQTNESEGLSKPVTPQNLPQTATKAVSNTNVIKPGMYRIERVAHRTNVSRPQPKSNQMKDKVVPNTSQVKFKKTEVEDHPRISSISNKTKSVTACNDSLKSKTSNVNVVCATCGKCVFNSNHDACVYQFLNDVNARTKKPKVVPNLVQGNITINRVYYVEGLNHNLFSVGQFCDADLEVAFRKSTCSVRDLQGNDLLTASPTQAWLWHRRLSHLNFDYINLLSKKDVVIGLPKLKHVKDQLCSSCEVSKAKRSSFKTKTVPSSKGRLHLLYMDLCGPMRVASINGKKYILVIVDDYSRYTWTLFLRSKDETPEVLKDFITMIQRNLQASVISVRTDRGTEFLNKTLNAFFKEEGIEHQTSTPRTPEQNGVVEKRNRTLVEAARTMLSASKLPLFFWAEAIATACYTQNRSIIILTHEKTPYHIINDRKPSIKHLHIFGCICYLTRDGDNLDKMKEKGDPCILVGYSTQSKG
ncbi:retrovirus-related pol polyprotein from transposon TNT 1-94 [Tanacetum coccineum]